MKALFVSALAICYVGTAHADQCLLIEREQAARALSILASARKVETYCEPCRDHAARALRLRQVEASAVGGESSRVATVRANGEELDLAYTFADGANVGALVGCYPAGYRSGPAGAN